MRLGSVVIISSIPFALLLAHSHPQTNLQGNLNKPIKSFYAVLDTSLARQYFKKGASLAKDTKYDSSNYYYQKASVLYEKAANELNEKDLWE